MTGGSNDRAAAALDGAAGALAPYLVQQAAQAISDLAQRLQTVADQEVIMMLTHVIANTTEAGKQITCAGDRYLDTYASTIADHLEIGLGTARLYKGICDQAAMDGGLLAEMAEKLAAAVTRQGDLQNQLRMDAADLRSGS